MKAIAPGTATITAKAADGSGKKATCKVTVKKKVTVENKYESQGISSYGMMNLAEQSSTVIFGMLNSMSLAGLIMSFSHMLILKII